jgi:hypothetical protein
MKTKTKEPQVEEVDLIKVKTIKAKHVDLLLVEAPADASEATYLFLAYLQGRDAILARHRTTQHLTAIRAIAYYTQVIDDAPKGEWRQAKDAAYAKVHALPQVLVD